MKKQNGITLISLVVTIIVLIILAGISINLILGQDGIITKAREAKQNMELAADEEAISLNELYAQMSGESNGIHSYDATAKLVEFKKQIASAITDMGITTSENADATTMSSNIRSLTGASSADKVSYDNTNSGLSSSNVQSAVDELSDSLGGMSFGYDETTQKYGYYVTDSEGADTFTPFNVINEVGTVNSSGSPSTYSKIDITNLPNYETLTIDDFLIVPTSGTLYIMGNYNGLIKQNYYPKAIKIQDGLLYISTYFGIVDQYGVAFSCKVFSK